MAKHKWVAAVISLVISKLLVLGVAIPPLIGNPYNGYINPYYWVDDHPLLYGNNGSLDPGTSGVITEFITGRGPVCTWMVVPVHFDG